jgi:hypothetical protein
MDPTGDAGRIRDQARSTDSQDVMNNADRAQRRLKQRPLQWPRQCLGKARRQMVPVTKRQLA